MISNDLKFGFRFQNGQNVAETFHERREHVVIDVSFYKQRRRMGDKHNSKTLIGAADHRFYRVRQGILLYQ